MEPTGPIHTMSIVTPYAVKKQIRHHDKPVRNQSDTMMNQDEINTNAAAGAAASAAALVYTTAFVVVITVAASEAAAPAAAFVLILSWFMMVSDWFILVSDWFSDCKGRLTCRRWPTQHEHTRK